MRLRAAIAALAAMPVSLVATAPAAAQSPLDATARLEGTYQLSGHVTTAVHIRGEHAGQTVLRTWSFAPGCAAGPCQTVTLTRQRAGGTDTVLLQLTGPDQYAGSGTFYAPLRCGRRRIGRAERVPFTVSVQITAATLVGGVPVATRVNASYSNPYRTNLTRCVTVPGHDAALYSGGRTG